MLTLAEIKSAQPIEPTKAVKAADEWRDAVNRDREKIIAPDYSCVVYFFDLAGQPCAIGYKGRAKQPALHLRYRSIERRDEQVAEWMNRMMKRKAERRKPDPRALAVGDVLRASWGYDQTNVDYYKVTRLVGKASVELVEIGQQREGCDHWMQGQCIPDKTNILSEPFVKRAQGDSVRICSVRYASKVEPTIVAGAEIYSADRWSSYA